VIEYHPQKDKPQVLFLRARIPVENLRIDMKGYEERKKLAMERTRQMISYIRETRTCRSLIIGRYFGDAAIRPCGVCDNCRRKKDSSIGREEFDAILHRMLNMVKYEAMEPALLFSKMNDVEEEKSWKILEFLQKENKVEFDDLGRIRMK
jgi:ATP-dependent DNA helicase RecQ